MKINAHITILILALYGFINVNAQEKYPQNYFRNPLNIPMQLVANFGELRTDHFHMGLDIRTESRENLPVYAAAEGYVSRIRIEKYGYGRAIYINHPNGYTTLYAHLNSFYDALEQYVKDKQYEDEKWEQDFELPANLFIVSKGQFIANSGNTGGSQGPHLHFEIRDTKTGNNLNPLLFGLSMPDYIPPVIYSLFWYDRRYSIYMAQPQSIPVSKKNAAYTSASAVVKVGSPIITLGIRMEDLNNASSFRFGVYHAALYMDDSLLFEFKLDDFSYDDSRYVNASMDYTRWIKAKQGIQYLSVLPGNKLDVFSPLESDGKILLSDTAIHKIRIELNDEKYDVTSVNLLVQYNKTFQKDYLFPADAFVCDVGEQNDIQTANAKIHFDENAFYDPLPLTVYETASKIAKQVSPTIHIGDQTIPVHNDYDIMIKKSAVLNDTLKNKVVMQLQRSNSPTVKKGIWQGEWMQSSFDELGDARLLIDTIAPTLIPVGWKNGMVFKTQKNLTVKCMDDISEVATFNASLDGSWLMFARKSDYFIYTFDEHCTTGAHVLSITATDVAGNSTTQTFNFVKQ